MINLYDFTRVAPDVLKDHALREYYARKKLADVGENDVVCDGPRLEWPTGTHPNILGSRPNLVSVMRGKGVFCRALTHVRFAEDSQ